MLDRAWIQSLIPYRRLWVGFSGGLDSTVLLHALVNIPEVAGKVTAIHVNHGLSPHANVWQASCQRVCEAWSVPLVTESVHLSTFSNLEENARRARMEVFLRHLASEDGLLLAHHADDQVETFFLQLCRGAGIDGLAAMPERKRCGQGEVLRPFLNQSRQQLKNYADRHALQWVEDESNDNGRFSRNFIRHDVLPLLEKKWPGVYRNVVQCAQHCQQARANLDELAEIDEPLLACENAVLPFERLRSLSDARRVNVLRTWLKRNNTPLPSTKTLHRLINEGLHAANDRQVNVSWGQVSVRCYQQAFHLMLKNDVASKVRVPWNNFPASLVLVEKNLCLHAKKSTTGVYIAQNTKLEVRFREGGETIRWHGQTKALKKLFQQWRVPPWLRDAIPLLFVEDELVAVIGYMISTDDGIQRVDGAFYQIEARKEDSIR